MVFLDAIYSSLQKATKRIACARVMHLNNKGLLISEFATPAGIKFVPMASSNKEQPKQVGALLVPSFFLFRSVRASACNL